MDTFVKDSWFKVALLFCLFLPSFIGAASAPTCTISISPSTIKQGESADEYFKIIGPVSKVIWRADGILSYIGTGLVEDYPEISPGREGGYKIQPGKIGTGSNKIEVYGPGGNSSCSATIKVVAKETVISDGSKEIIGTLSAAAKLRKCPSTDCEVIRYYAETAKIKIVGLDDGNEWYHVKPNDDYGNELDGWMYYSLFTEDFRSSFTSDNSNQEAISPNDKISKNEDFIGKLGFSFPFFHNKNFQTISVTVLIILFVIIGALLFRKKLRVFLRKIIRSSKTFLAKSKPIETKYNFGAPHKKRFYIIVIIVAVIFIGAGTGLGFFIKSKFENLNQQLLSETSKKEDAQKLAAENAVKMGEAQEQANQEKIAKNQKALELAQKENTEREMNADKDGDGLTYRQEISYGTSDSNTDSDNDGVPDGQDMHPAGGDRLIAQHFEWNYGGKLWTWDYSFPSDWYDYYKNKKRIEQGIGYVTSDNKYIKQIADMLKTKADENGYTKSEFAAEFIQSLGYVSDSAIGYDDYPKYPLETLAEQNGDCEDTSYLSAAIISAMGLDAKLVLLVGNPGHMAIAVAYSGSPAGYFYPLSNGRNYYYIETTGSGWDAGKMPDEYHYFTAMLVDVYSGQTYSALPSYIKPCDPSSVVAGYYYDGVNFYSDSQCYNSVYCMYYKGYYVNGKAADLFWDSGCSQVVTSGCSKSTSNPGYFTNGIGYYSDSRCTQTARVCRFSYSDYWDGYSHYWDSNCTQRVLSWCGKSIYKPGYFFSSIDSNYYIDNQCTQEAGL